MANLVLTRWWDSHPGDRAEVDWGHPFFKGASKAVVILGGRRRTFTKNFPTYVLNPVAGTVRVSATKYGPVFLGTVAGTQINLSQVITARTTALFVGDGGLRTKKDSTNSYYGYFGLSRSAAHFGNGVGTGPNNRRSWTYPSAQYAVCVKPNSTISTAPIVYTDGAQAVVTSGGGTATSYNWGDSTTYWEIGYDPANPTTSQNDKPALVVFVDWDVPDALMASVSKNPWQLFKPRVIGLYKAASSGNTALTVTDSTHAHAADAVVLSTQKLLTGLDATHAHAADAVVLSTQTSLAGTDATHGHTADTVVLSTQTALTGLDATHGHAADTVVLAQNYTLVGTDATHGHTADTSGCTQQAADTYALIGVDATHAHTADAVVVAHNYTLTGIDLSHAHTAEPVTLSTQNSLSVLGATHGHSAEQIILSVQVVLAALDATHGHTADAVAVSTAAPSFTPEQLAEILAYVEANMAVPTANEIATAVWQMVLEGALTAEQIMRIKLAAMAGKRQGLGTATELYMAQDGTTPRITFTPTDEHGNGATVVDGS